MNVIRTSVRLSLSDGAFVKFSEQKNKSFYIQSLIEKDVNPSTDIEDGETLAFLIREITELKELILSGRARDPTTLKENVFTHEEKNDDSEECLPNFAGEEEETSLSAEEIITLNSLLNLGGG